MGLAVEVGVLAYLNDNDEEGATWLHERFVKVNEVLVENGLPSHVEPETLPPMNNRASLKSYPYSFLHYLRRFAAHVSSDPNWKPTPVAESEDPADDPVVDDETAMFNSHLLCHSDCEGFYLPIDFAEPLFADEDRVPGGMLGSSQGLMRELVAVAPFLGINLSDGTLSDAEAIRINSISETEGWFWIEQAVWISLFEAMRLSIEHKSAICFS
jgi:hypothetical protein